MLRPTLLAVCVSVFLGQAASAQDFLGKTADGWARQLKHSDAKMRRAAAFALGKMGKGAAPSLNEMKAAFGHESDAKVRDALVYAMGEICRTGVGRQRELEALFVSAMSQPDPQLRRSAAFALGCLATHTIKDFELANKKSIKVTDMSQESWQALDDAIANDNEPMVRQNAAWALGKFLRFDQALTSLGKAVKDGDSFVKRDAASALLHVSDDTEKLRPMLKDLAKMCRDTNSEVRRAGLNVLVVIVDGRDKEHIPALKWALDDRDIENRRNAALALSNIGGEEAAAGLAVLLDAARTSDPELRQQAIAGISNLGPAAARAVPDLVRWLQTDTDPKMREYAALAIGGIGQPSEQAVPVLMQKIQDTREEIKVRVSCSMALSKIGPVAKSKEIVPALLAVVGSPQQAIEVRERVVWSLRVHTANLRDMPGTKDTFERILKEPLTEQNRMLRYDCAYMLGMIWQFKAPDRTLDVLLEFLHDRDVKLYDKTVTGAGGTAAETKGGVASSKELGRGDGRTMALDALTMMGPTRYSPRKDIMKQLEALSGDPKLNKEVRDGAAKLLKAAP